LVERAVEVAYDQLRGLHEILRALRCTDAACRQHVDQFGASRRENLLRREPDLVSQERERVGALLVRREVGDLLPRDQLERGLRRRRRRRTVLRAQPRDELR